MSVRTQRFYSDRYHDSSGFPLQIGETHLAGSRGAAACGTAVVSGYAISNGVESDVTCPACLDLLAAGARA